MPLDEGTGYGSALRGTSKDTEEGNWKNKSCGISNDVYRFAISKGLSYILLSHSVLATLRKEHSHFQEVKLLVQGQLTIRLF